MPKISNLPVATLSDLTDNDIFPITDSETVTTKSVTLSLLRTFIQSWINSAVGILTNKTINLTDNTVTGTKAQFNSAVSDWDIVFLDSADTISWVKTFLDGKIGFRNVANTITSFFKNTATVARTYTFPDRSGNIADDTDLTTTLNSAKSYADSLVVWLLDDRGNYNASGNVFPSSGWSGTAWAILKGDLWSISVAGTLWGVAVTAWDVIRAIVDTPGNTLWNWSITENNFWYVAENSANKDATGWYVGLTLFKINFKNVANTITSFFTNSNTVARTYTFQDRNGTIADDTDLALKANLTSPTLVTPNLWTPTAGNLSSCTADWTNAVGFRNIPSNSQSANYTTVLADAGKSIDHPSTDANARTFTIDSNANVAYPIGTCLTFTNMTAQVVTIAITADTMYLAWAGTTWSRSLAQYWMATAKKQTSTTWLISGTNLT